MDVERNQNFGSCTGRSVVDLIQVVYLTSLIEVYTMSFGRPGGLSTFSVAPPDRGSFPLDHDGMSPSLFHLYSPKSRRTPLTR
jgi:hypothetical protein